MYITTTMFRKYSKVCSMIVAMLECHVWWNYLCFAMFLLFLLIWFFGFYCLFGLFLFCFNYLLFSFFIAYIFIYVHLLFKCCPLLYVRREIP